MAPRDAAIFCAAFGVEVMGNSRPESDPHGELLGQNTLFRAMSDESLAEMFDASVVHIQERLSASKEVLLEVRGKRPRPHRDDKIIAAWNGLTIGALARGARVLGMKNLADAAQDAALFLKNELWDGRRLYRSYRGKRGNTEAFAVDYVFLIAGLIELHAVFPNSDWLEWAGELQRKLDSDFWDSEQVGYVVRPQVAGNTLLVMRDDYDGAEPSSNHMAAENLLKLAALLDVPDHASRAESLLCAGSTLLETHSFAAPVLLAALDLQDRGVMKFQIPDNAETRVLDKMRNCYFPRAVFTKGDGDEVIVCEGVTCRVFSA
ncbi:MAG: thioredoxin domain-containing protein [Gloeobacteraceae cyanobacterium ES-bin-144]|nr:thioredoxin domain-containing protein [Verrucomicrobiales bacterium]